VVDFIKFPRKNADRITRCWHIAADAQTGARLLGAHLSVSDGGSGLFRKPFYGLVKFCLPKHMQISLYVSCRTKKALLYPRGC
jgi:hypothetical protein